MGIQYTIQSVNHLNRFGWCVFFNDACSRSSENLSALIKPSEEHRLLTRTRRSELKRFNVCSNTSLGCGFKHFYFHPYLGKISNLTDIFQRGWNHQVVPLPPCKENNLLQMGDFEWSLGDSILNWHSFLFWETWCSCCRFIDVCQIPTWSMWQMLVVVQTLACLTSLLFISWCVMHLSGKEFLSDPCSGLTPSLTKHVSVHPLCVSKV